MPHSVRKSIPLHTLYVRNRHDKRFLNFSVRRRESLIFSYGTWIIWGFYFYTWFLTLTSDGGSLHSQTELVPRRKKRFTSFPSPAGMSLTKLPLGRNNSIMTSWFPPRESLVVTSRLGTGNSWTFFLRCIIFYTLKSTVSLPRGTGSIFFGYPLLLLRIADLSFLEENRKHFTWREPDLSLW